MCLRNTLNSCLILLTLTVGFAALPNPASADEATGSDQNQIIPTRQETAAFNRLDENGDGSLLRDELPRPARNLFERIDKNGDQKISRQEDTQFRRNAQNRRQRSALPAGTQLLRNVEYVPDGHQRQKLDLYLPDRTDLNDQTRPLVVWIHGGGWRAGNKDACPATFLLEHGYAVASINYRLTEHDIFPAQIHDCKAAIRYLRANSANHQIDPQRIGVWGSSAGGHLAALLGTSNGVPELEGTLGTTGVSSNVQAVCDYYGPTDLATMNQQATIPGPINHDAPDSPESRLLGAPLQSVLKIASQASPITHVSPNDPAFLIMHGDQDPLVPVAQSEIFAEKLQAAAVDVKLIVVAGAGHGPFHSADDRTTVRKFFDQKLKASQAPAVQP